MPGVNNMADLLKKMGGMGGMGGGMDGMADIAKMPASMGLGGRNGKFNMGAMQSNLNKNVKTAQTKERMQQKLEQRRAAMVAQAQAAQAQAQAAQAQAAQAQAQAQAQSLVFSTGEKVERTPRVTGTAPSVVAAGTAPSVVAAVAAVAAPPSEHNPTPTPTANKKKNKNKK